MSNPVDLTEVSLDEFSLSSRSTDSIKQFGGCLMARVVVSQHKCPARGQCKSGLRSDTSACPGHNGCHPLEPLIFIHGVLLVMFAPHNSSVPSRLATAFGGDATLARDTS